MFNGSHCGDRRPSVGVLCDQFTDIFGQIEKGSAKSTGQVQGAKYMRDTIVPAMAKLRQIGRPSRSAHAARDLAAPDLQGNAVCKVAGRRGTRNGQCRARLSRSTRSGHGGPSGADVALNLVPILHISAVDVGGLAACVNYWPESIAALSQQLRISQGILRRGRTLFPLGANAQFVIDPWRPSSIAPLTVVVAPLECRSKPRTQRNA